MLFDQMWLTTWAAAGFAVVLGALLWSTVAPAKVAVWLAAKLLVIAPRLVHARLYQRSRDAQHAHWYRLFIIMLAADALVWGMAGWWLLPLDRVDIAAVIAASLVGATALATFTLYSDWRAAVCFVLPVMLPMAAYMTQRGDRYGAFGAGAVLLFTVLLLLETRRSQRNLVELLSLRYTTDRIARERADALQLAQRHSAVKSRFLATMSHELRTPLHGILGLTRQVRERLERPADGSGAPGGAAEARRLALVERSGQHLLAVINDVLDFSRIEAGRLALVEETFDLAALVDDVLALSAVAAADKGLALRCRLRVPRPCRVRGDAARVRQVLHNLVGNAVKFTPRGSVRVSVWREPGRTRGGPAVAGLAPASSAASAAAVPAAPASDRVLIAVQDTGPGIPAAELVRIFDAFHQVDAADSRRHAGTGLGLSISRELARAMGGDLACTSTPGEGSTFTFSVRLPAAAPAAAATMRTRGHGAQTSGTTGRVISGVTSDVSSPVTSGGVAGTDQDADTGSRARRQAAAPGGPGSATPAADCAPPAAPAGQADHGPRSLAGLRVLLAEDNPVNALVAEAVLQQLGCVVETVEDGAAAVARVQAGQRGGPPPAARPIELVLMDCQMPLMDGFEAARRIRAAEAASGQPPVPIVALTASALPGDRERCLSAGMQGHLAKPFSPEDLTAVLHACLRP
ncbi:MAG: response regulator [Burkholderiales bacterium]|nr:response regulator [Burkholderiales bacterium]